MKYPRTYHLPWSEGGTNDDKRIDDISAFFNKDLVITEKLDSENTVMTNQTIHARSEEGYGKPWQTYLKKQWAAIRANIPNNFHICGENMYAVHSIEYDILPSAFFIFGICHRTIFENIWLSWEDVVIYATLLG